MTPTIEILSQDEVQRNAMRSLAMSASLDGPVDVVSSRVLAALTRRAAGILCPCPQRTITDELEGVLRGIVEEDIGEKIEDMIRQLITIGDLQELSVPRNGRSRRMMYATPPSFVLREGDRHVILGIASDGQSILSETFRDQVEVQGAVRFFRGDPEKAKRVLTGQGLTQITDKEWLRLPSASSASDYINNFSRALDQASHVSSEVEGIKILDTSEPPKFYKGRWREQRTNDEGRYVARRAQRFGSDLWSYVEIREGSVTRLVDLPIFKNTSAPHDEAWRLQAALDVSRGVPQTYRTRSDGKKVLLDVFSPLPSWVERRFRVIGEQMSRQQGAFQTYRFDGDASDEKTLLEQYLWMQDESGT